MESKVTEIDKEKNSLIKDQWESNADMYADYLNQGTLSGSVALYTATRASEFKSICEVGVGSGYSSFIFAISYLSKGAEYYNSDISENMIKHMEETYKSSHLANTNLTFQILEESDSIKVPQKEKDLRNETSSIYATVANNESLPYPDEAFDLYLSNLSLMLVDNPYNMLSEAYRVTQKGGTVGFTVVGRPENQGIWPVLGQALKKAGATHFHSPIKSLKINTIENVKSILEEAGFTSVRSYYTQMNPNMTAEEAFRFSSNAGQHKKIITEMEDSSYQIFKEEFFKIWEENFGEDSGCFPSVEIIISTAKKQ